MQDKLERLIQAIYRKWKAAHPKPNLPHPDEEALACFIEGRLSAAENEGIKTHLISCDRCAETVAMQMQLKTDELKEVPEDLLERIKKLVMPEQDKASVLEIWLKLKEKALEILNTTGDVLVGQELVPAPILRSRNIRDFKDEVTILKDFKDIRVEIKIENKLGQAFSLNITVKEKATQKVTKELRVTLIRDDLELESYLTDSGRVTFEHVLLGKYTVEISRLENKLASILLDIRT
jgi:hypothetical protein